MNSSKKAIHSIVHKAHIIKPIKSLKQKAKYRRNIHIDTMSLKFCSVNDRGALSRSLFVFSIDGPQQNAGSLLTPDSDTVFNALLHGTLSFTFHGSFNNHLFLKI